VALGALVGTQPVEAAWGDGEHMSATVTSGVLNPPTPVSCTGGLLVVTVSWSAPTAGVTPLGYEITVTRSNGSLVAGFPVQVGGGTTSWSSGTLLSALIAGTYTVTVRSTVQSWRSAAISWTMNVAVLGLIVTC